MLATAAIAHSQSHTWKNGLYTFSKYGFKPGEKKVAVYVDVKDRLKLSGEITIPYSETHDGVKYRVWQIGLEGKSKGLNGCHNVTKITIPEGIKKVFYIGNCDNLEAIKLPKSVNEITFPYYSNPFPNNPKLKTIQVHEDNPYFYSTKYGMLFKKTSEHLIWVAQKTLFLAIPKFCKSIEAFENTVTSSLYIPRTVSTIKNGAFPYSDKALQAVYWNTDASPGQKFAPLSSSLRMDLYVPKDFMEGFKSQAAKNITIKELVLSTAVEENDSKEITLMVGKEKKLAPTVTPANGCLIWNSDNLAVARVNPDGTVIGLAKGECSIKAYTTSACEKMLIPSSEYVKYKVKVEEIIGTSLEVPETFEIWPTGWGKKEFKLPVTVEPADATLLFSSSDEEKVTVDREGRLDAKKSKGTATITVRAGATGPSKECKVTIVPYVPAESLFPPSQVYEIKLFTNQTWTVPECIVKPDNASNKDVKYYVQDDEISYDPKTRTVTALKSTGSKYYVHDPARLEFFVKHQGSSLDQTDCSATFYFTISEAEVTKLELPEDFSLTVGETKKMAPSVLEPSYANVVWKSNDEGIATVDKETGEITGVAQGKVLIYVKSRKEEIDGEEKLGWISTLISVEAPASAVSVTGVLLSETAKALRVGESFTLSATVQPDNASNKKVSWSTSDDQIATVDEQGLVTAVGKAGEKATITATADDGGATASCEVAIVKADAGEVSVTGVTLSETAKELKVGETFTLIAIVQPDNASNKKVSWSTGDAKIASVDGNGLVTAIGEGKTIITVTTDDGGATAGCELVVKPKDAVVNPGSGPSTAVGNAPQEALAVIPNPVSESLQLQGLSDRTLVRIYTCNGLLVKTVFLQPDARLDVRCLAPGMYILRAEGWTVRFVKQ